MTPRIRPLNPGRLVAIGAPSALFGLAGTLPAALAGARLEAAGAGLLLALAALAGLTAALLLSERFGRAPHAGRRPGWAVFLLALAILVAVWGTALLVFYPGCVTDDGLDILHMVLGLPTRTDAFRYDGWNNHHPAVYAWAIGLTMRGAQALGLPTSAALAAVSAWHMLALAGAVAFAVAWIYRRFDSPLVAGAVLAFFALNPVVAKLSVTIWKDIPFSGALLVFCLLLIDLVERGPAPRRVAALAAVGLAAGLLRNNGMAAVAGSLVLAALLSPPARRGALAALAGAAVSYALITGPVFALAQVAPGHAAEGLGIPLQQVARALSEGARPRGGDRETLDAILPLELWEERANPVSANGLKFSPEFDDAYLEAHLGDFLSAWAHLGSERPGAYARAWADQTGAFWHIDPASRIWTAASRPVELGGVTVDARSKLPLSAPAADAIVSGAVEHLALLFNQAVLSWLAIAAAALLAARRDPAAAIGLTPVVLLVATLLVAAPSSDFRYALPMLMVLPVSLCLVTFRGRAPAAAEGRS
ncbi:MAG: DUF6020 family protein [Collinsella sp.]|nr:DUF6020 family protein [Collinsella sp.]